MQTPESSLEALLNRVTKLEAQNRRLKKAGVAALLVAVVVITMGQAKSDRTIDADTVKAHKVFADIIQLSDTENAVTLLMPGFMTVQSHNGKDSVSISTSNGPSVDLSDKEGFAAALGASSLITINTGSKSRTSAASVVLFGKDGKVIWSAP